LIPRLKKRLPGRHFFYDERVNGLGADFLEDIEKAINFIQKFPAAFPILDGPYRRFILRRFPYCIIYRFDENNIFIMAVMHQKRKPGYWKERMY